MNESHTLRDAVVAALRSVYDPEIPVNVYDLGLIYGIDIDDAGKVSIRMTLTAPACPVAGILPVQIESRLKAIPGVADATVQIVWDPPWTPERMSEAARLQLGFAAPGEDPPNRLRVLGGRRPPDPG